jgi:hypothetical protein
MNGPEPESTNGMTEQPSPSELPQTYERRAFVRYSRKLEALWTLLGVRGPDLTSGELFDLSTTGVGLLLDREFLRDTLLLIRLPTATLGWNSHLVRVKNCKEEAPGVFQVGCSFVKPLTVAQLQSFLG